MDEDWCSHDLPPISSLDSIEFNSLPYHGGCASSMNLSLEVWTVNDVVGMILCRDVMGGAPY